jgi:hypothetical protein
MKNSEGFGYEKIDLPADLSPFPVSGDFDAGSGKKEAGSGAACRT